jgi:hypothetical protein
MSVLQKKFIPIIPRLIEEANKSTIKSQLAASVLKGAKMVSRPCSNTVRNICRGKTCGSLHAEARAILDYFGRDLSYDPKKGWCFFHPEHKGKDR